MKKAICSSIMVGILFLGSTVAAFGLAVTDVTLKGENADLLIYGPDNDTAAEVSVAMGSQYFLIDKSDDSAGGSFLGTDFTLTAAGGNTGTYILSWANAGPPLPMYFDFVFVLKASQEMWAGYFFDDVQIGTASGAYDGTYIVQFDPNKKGVYPDLSHISVYGQQGEDPGPSPVPEPATMLLFGTGLVGLAGIARRKVQ